MSYSKPRGKQQAICATNKCVRTSSKGAAGKKDLKEGDLLTRPFAECSMLHKADSVDSSRCILLEDLNDLHLGVCSCHVEKFARRCVCCAAKQLAWHVQAHMRLYSFPSFVPPKSLIVTSLFVSRALPSSSRERDGWPKLDPPSHKEGAADSKRCSYSVSAAVRCLV